MVSNFLAPPSPWSPWCDVFFGRGLRRSQRTTISRKSAWQEIVNTGPEGSNSEIYPHKILWSVPKCPKEDMDVQGCRGIWWEPERERERESYEKVSKVVDHDQEVHMISRFYFPAGFLAQLFWQRFGVLCLACLDIPPCCASSVHGHTRLRFFKTFCVFECKQVWLQAFLNLISQRMLGFI